MQADINATLNIPEWVPYVITETTESNGNVANLTDAVSTLYQTLDGIVNSATDREDDTNVLDIDQDEEMEFIFSRLPSYFEGDKVNVACGVVNASEAHVTDFAAKLGGCMHNMVKAAVPKIDELGARVDVVNADKTKVDVASLVSDINQASQVAADSTKLEPIVAALDSCIVDAIKYLKQGLDTELNKLSATIPEAVLNAEKEAWSKYEAQMESSMIYLDGQAEGGDFDGGDVDGGNFDGGDVDGADVDGGDVEEDSEDYMASNAANQL